jgi:DNA polymerase
VKCHPPRNRNPRRDELASCRQFLDEQISIIDPRIIVLLGRVAATGFLGDAKLEAVRGRMRSVDGRRMLVTYHPAAAMRFPERGIPFEADIRLLSRLLSSPPEP